MIYKNEIMIKNISCIVVKNENNTYIYLNHEKIGLNLSFNDIQYLLSVLYDLMFNLKQYMKVEKKYNCIKLIHWI